MSQSRDAATATPIVNLNAKERMCAMLATSGVVPSYFCLSAEQHSAKVTAASNPARTLFACAVSHTNMVNNLVATVRPPLEWSCANHIALLETENLKSALCRPRAKECLRSRKVQPKPTDDCRDGDKPDQQGAN